MPSMRKGRQDLKLDQRLKLDIPHLKIDDCSWHFGDVRPNFFSLFVSLGFSIVHYYRFDIIICI